MEMHPEILQNILSTMLNIIMFEDCKNQWAMSRPLFVLILLYEDYFKWVSSFHLFRPFEYRDIVITVSFAKVSSECSQSTNNNPWQICSKRWCMEWNEVYWLEIGISKSEVVFYFKTCPYTTSFQIHPNSFAISTWHLRIHEIINKQRYRSIPCQRHDCLIVNLPVDCLFRTKLIRFLHVTCF